MQFRNRQRKNAKPKRLYSVRWLEDALDDLTSKIIRVRGAGCVTCPARTRLTCSHIFTRTWRPTRWDISPDGNCHVQCENCNNANEANPGPLRGYYVSRFGERALEDLARRAHSHDKMGYADLVALWESYKLILKELKEQAA